MVAGRIRAALCPTERAKLQAYGQPGPAAMRCCTQAAGAGKSCMAHMPEARMAAGLLDAADKRRRADTPEPWALPETVEWVVNTAADMSRRADMSEPQVLPEAIEWAVNTAADMSRRAGIRRNTGMPGNSRARTLQARQGVPFSARISRRSRAARRR